jgi:hypothetical protein
MAASSRGPRCRAAASAAWSTTAEYASKTCHRVPSVAEVASQRRLVVPVSSAPTSNCLPKLESSSSRLAWIASRSATAALTAAAAWSLVIPGTVIGIPPAAGTGPGRSRSP